jgi:hypothetical protein
VTLILPIGSEKQGISSRHDRRYNARKRLEASMNIVMTVLVCCLSLLIEVSLSAAPPLKVLLIGNSQMQCYDLPQMMKVMSESAPAGNPRIEIGRALFGGKGLKGLWEAGEGQRTPLAMIAAGKWDYVVIQEIFNGEQPEFEHYATKFDDEIRRAGAKTVLLATASVTEHYSWSYHYPDSFKKLNDMQVSFGTKRGISVAPAGYAWMRYWGPHPTEQQMLDLYHKDKGHPGAKGTYIYACLLYAVITGKTPEGLTSEFKTVRGGIAIPKEEAARMQKVAWEQYQAGTAPGAPLTSPSPTPRACPTARR